MSSFCIKISIVDLVELKCNNMQNSRKTNSGEKKLLQQIFFEHMNYSLSMKSACLTKTNLFKICSTLKLFFSIFIQLKTFKSKLNEFEFHNLFHVCLKDTMGIKYLDVIVNKRTLN